MEYYPPCNHPHAMISNHHPHSHPQLQIQKSHLHHNYNFPFRSQFSHHSSQNPNSLPHQHQQLYSRSIQPHSATYGDESGELNTVTEQNSSAALTSNNHSSNQSGQESRVGAGFVSDISSDPVSGYHLAAVSSSSSSISFVYKPPTPTSCSPPPLTTAVPDPNSQHRHHRHSSNSFTQQLSVSSQPATYTNIPPSSTAVGFYPSSVQSFPSSTSGPITNSRIHNHESFPSQPPSLNNRSIQAQSQPQSYSQSPAHSQPHQYQFQQPPHPQYSPPPYPPPDHRLVESAPSTVQASDLRHHPNSHQPIPPISDTYSRPTLTGRSASTPRPSGLVVPHIQNQNHIQGPWSAPPLQSSFPNYILQPPSIHPQVTSNSQAPVEDQPNSKKRKRDGESPITTEKKKKKTTEIVSQPQPVFAAVFSSSPASASIPSLLSSPAQSLPHPPGATAIPNNKSQHRSNSTTSSGSSSLASISSSTQHSKLPAVTSLPLTFPLYNHNNRISTSFSVYHDNNDPEPCSFPFPKMDKTQTRSDLGSGSNSGDGDGSRSAAEDRKRPTVAEAGGAQDEDLIRSSEDQIAGGRVRFTENHRPIGGRQRASRVGLDASIRENTHGDGNDENGGMTQDGVKIFDLSKASSMDPVASSSKQRNAPGSRNNEPAKPVERYRDPNSTTHSSSTTASFTKRKNWSNIIISEIQDFMHVLVSPNAKVSPPKPNTTQIPPSPRSRSQAAAFVPELKEGEILPPTDWKFMFASPAIEKIGGWKPDDLLGRKIEDFLHPGDLQSWAKEIGDLIARAEATAARSGGGESSLSGNEVDKSIGMFYRFRKHPSIVAPPEPGNPEEEAEMFLYPTQEQKPWFLVEAKISYHRASGCLFCISRPYPTKTQSMLDGMLGLKMENERLKAELKEMYKDLDHVEDEAEPYNVSSSGSSTSSFAHYDEIGKDEVELPATGPSGLPPDAPMEEGWMQELDQPMAGASDKGKGKAVLGKPRKASGLGPPAIGKSKDRERGDQTAEEGETDKQADGEKKKKKPRADGGEFVCRECGTVDSPEWRKGPDGPKSLCNACGLRYAKKAKIARQGGSAGTSSVPIPSGSGGSGTNNHRPAVGMVGVPLPAGASLPGIVAEMMERQRAADELARTQQEVDQGDQQG